MIVPKRADSPPLRAAQDFLRAPTALAAPSQSTASIRSDIADTESVVGEYEVYTPFHPGAKRYDPMMRPTFHHDVQLAPAHDKRPKQRSEPTPTQPGIARLKAEAQPTSVSAPVSGTLAAMQQIMNSQQVDSFTPFDAKHTTPPNNNHLNNSNNIIRASATLSKMQVAHTPSNSYGNNNSKASNKINAMRANNNHSPTPTESDGFSPRAQTQRFLAGLESLGVPPPGQSDTPLVSRGQIDLNAPLSQIVDLFDPSRHRSPHQRKHTNSNGGTPNHHQQQYAHADGSVVGSDYYALAARKHPRDIPPSNVVRMPGMERSGSGGASQNSQLSLPPPPLATRPNHWGYADDHAAQKRSQWDRPADPPRLAPPSDQVGLGAGPGGGQSLHDRVWHLALNDSPKRQTPAPIPVAAAPRQMQQTAPPHQQVRGVSAHQRSNSSFGGHVPSSPSVASVSTAGPDTRARSNSAHQNQQTPPTSLPPQSHHHQPQPQAQHQTRPNVTSPLPGSQTPLPQTARSLVSPTPDSQSKISAADALHVSRDKRTSGRASVLGGLFRRARPADPLDIAIIRAQPLFNNPRITDKNGFAIRCDFGWEEKGFRTIGDILDEDGLENWDLLSVHFDPNVHSLVKLQLRLLMKAIPPNWLQILREDARARRRFV